MPRRHRCGVAQSSSSELAFQAHPSQPHSHDARTILKDRLARAALVLWHRRSLARAPRRIGLDILPQILGSLPEVIRSWCAHPPPTHHIYTDHPVFLSTKTKERDQVQVIRWSGRPGRGRDTERVITHQHLRALRPLTLTPPNSKCRGSAPRECGAITACVYLWRLGLQLRLRSCRRQSARGWSRRGAARS